MVTGISTQYPYNYENYATPGLQNYGSNESPYDYQDAYGGYATNPYYGTTADSYGNYYQYPDSASCGSDSEMLTMLLPMLMSGTGSNSSSSMLSSLLPIMLLGSGSGCGSGDDQTLETLILTMLPELLNPAPVSTPTKTVTVSPTVTVPIPTVSPAPTTTVTTTVNGDPHFTVTGANGSPLYFKHTGVTGDTYNIFDGNNLDIDALYEQWTDHPNDAQVMGKMRIKDGNDVISWDMNGQPTINGNPLSNYLKDGSLTLNDGTVLSYDGSKLTINDGSGQVVISHTDGNNNDGLQLIANGTFSNLNGIVGQAIATSSNLTDAQCDAFDVTKTNPIKN